MKKLCLLLTLFVLLPACPRRVVINPEDVPAKNSSDWTIVSEPKKPAPPGAK
jgi:hypothetical protein